MRVLRHERGAVLMEAAITIPMLLLISVGIFEFGRAYQTWQVLTNAVREGARMAVVPTGDPDAVEARVRQYMEDGRLPLFAAADVQVDRDAAIVVNGVSESASRVTVNYPFDFMVLQPVARLVAPNTQAGEPITLNASTLMRNETQ